MAAKLSSQPIMGEKNHKYETKVKVSFLCLCFSVPVANNEERDFSTKEWLSSSSEEKAEIFWKLMCYQSLSLNFNFF